MLKEQARKRIAEARWRAGLSRKALATLTGGRVSAGTIRNLETGENVSTHLPQTIYILAAALDLDPSELIAEEVAS